MRCAARRRPSTPPSARCASPAATSAPAETSAQPQQQSAQPVVQTAQPSEQQSAVLFNSQQLDNYRLSTPENIPTADGYAAAPATSDATESAATQARTLDPYTAFPALAESVFAFADSLYHAGYTDSATAYLERFRIIKPLWLQWEKRADSLLNEFGKTRAEMAKQFDPLVLKIQNMNRAQAAYSLVKESADSLVALSPGDSLVAWAGEQKKIAYILTILSNMILIKIKLLIAALLL